MITPYSNIISVTTLEALLLDTYTGAAAAYSLRKLSASYTGSAIRVRRADNNAEQDIGFVNNELDTATLTSFCSGTDGFVKTWYDQSGNGRDATQTTAANQPQIVSSGSVILENGKPSLQFDGSNDAFTTSVSFTQPFFVSLVVKNIKASNTYPYYLDSNSTGRFLLYVEDTNGILASAAYVSGKLLISGINKTIQSLISVLYNTTSSFIAIDGTIEVSGGIETNNINSPIYIGSRNINAQYMQGTYQELIFWDSNQSTNRTGIETNINTNYNIYWDGSQTSLLDTYSGSAAAYSLRALSSAYTGPLVRVRRASDNAEQDIYAKYDGTLNVSALESFCSGTNGFVKTWYDQSGNGRDATQITLANQPQIVNSGSVILNNSKPTLNYASNQNLTIGNTSTFNFLHNGTSSTVLSVINTSSGVGQAIMGSEAGSQSSTGFGLWLNYVRGQSVANIVYNGSGANFSVNNISALNSVLTNNTYYLFNILDADNSTASLRSSISINNSADINNNTSLGTPSLLNSTNPLRLGTGGLGNFIGKMQEIIIYSISQSSNKIGISDNINTFYSIY